MPRKRNLSAEEQVLSVLWIKSSSAEQLARKLGASLYAVSKACKALKELRMIHHESDLWKIHYRDGKTQKIVTSGSGTLKSLLDTYERKARNCAFMENRKTHSGRRGSKAEWLAGARMIVGMAEEYHKYLSIFGFTTLPTRKQLRTAWKLRMKDIHPDVGGSDKDAALVNEAYEELSKLIDK